MASEGTNVQYGRFGFCFNSGLWPQVPIGLPLEVNSYPDPLDFCREDSSDPLRMSRLVGPFLGAELRTDASPLTPAESLLEWAHNGSGLQS